MAHCLLMTCVRYFLNLNIYSLKIVNVPNKTIDPETMVNGSLEKRESLAFKVKIFSFLMSEENLLKGQINNTVKNFCIYSLYRFDYNLSSFYNLYSIFCGLSLILVLNHKER